MLDKKIVGAIAGGFITVFPIWLIQVGGANKPGTLKNSWKASTVEYAKFQKQNPMQGYGSK